MPKNDIGGFYVSLGLDIDKGSFETGNRLVDNVGNSFNKLTGSARNAINVLGTITTQQSLLGGSSIDLSRRLDVTSEALDLWRATARLTTGDAKALDAALYKLSDVKIHLNYDGRGLAELQRQLNELGINYGDISNLSVDKQLEEILKRAQAKVAGGADKSVIAGYVHDILGGNSRDAFLNMLEQGRSVEEMLAHAQGTILTNAEDNQNLKAFENEYRETMALFDAMKKLFGSNLAKDFLPVLEELNNFLSENSGSITNGIKEFTGALGTIAEAVAPFAGEVLQSAVTSIVDLTKALADLVNGNIEGVGQNLEHFVFRGKDPHKVLGNSTVGYGSGADAILTGEDAGPSIPDLIKAGWNALVGNGTKPIKDGIIRPDGTVTQVAPDDWVFAARNVGDMARAFIPHNVSSVSAPAEYTINQTFNINGGSDMPQVLMQEAYRGTQEGLLGLMEQSSKRLQLMSGTR